MQQSPTARNPPGPGFKKSHGLKQKLQQGLAPSEDKNMKPKQQPSVTLDPEESGTRAIPEAIQNRSFVATHERRSLPPRGPTWYDLEAEPADGPVGVLEFEPVSGRAALEFQVWLDPDEGEATCVCLDEDGNVLQIARPLAHPDLKRR